MKIEAKLLASLRTPELKKIRAPNFFIFSTDSEKSLLDPEPVGGLLKTKKKIRNSRKVRNSQLAELGVRAEIRLWGPSPLLEESPLLESRTTRN